MARLAKLPLLLSFTVAVGSLPSELPLEGRAKGIVDLQGSCLVSRYMSHTAQFEGGGCPEYIRGVQAEIQWADLEPQHGVYNFSLLQSQLEQIKALGKYAVVKLNGNNKPTWMYDQIPQSKVIWSEEMWDNTTLMYWHPLFISSYLNVIDAYAAFVQRSYGDLVAYVRMNFNAVGTEHMAPPAGSPAYDMSAWFAPLGCVSNCSAVALPWSEAGDTAYSQVVLDRHVSAFGPQEKLLLRNNIVDDFNITYLTPSIEKHWLGFFHTGAAMEEDQVFNQDFRYTPYLEWCLPGTTFGFAEQAGFWAYTKKWPLHPKDMNVGVFSKVQFAYWLMLSNLHNGVAASGIHFDAMMYSPSHPEDVDRVPLNDSRYIESYRFFDAYAGYHAHPDSAPGAWVAFRGKGDNYPAGDYHFLMQSFHTSSAFDQGETGVGPRTAKFGAWCKTLPSKDSASYKVALSGETSKIKLRVVWYSEAEHHSWQLQYTAAAGGELKIAIQQDGPGTGDWQESTVVLEDIKFDAAAPEHIVLTNTGYAAVSFHMIEVRRAQGSEGSAALLV